MTDETRLSQDMQRGGQAERLLADETLTAAFTGLETAYLEAWKATAARDTDARERLWQAIQIVGKVRSQLASFASDGRIAKAEVDQVATLGERKKIFGIV